MNMIKMCFFKSSKKKYDIKLEQCPTHKKYSGEGYDCYCFLFLFLAILTRREKLATIKHNILDMMSCSDSKLGY